MQKRTFAFKWDKSSPEYTGKVWSGVDLDRDGMVHINTQFYLEGGDRVGAQYGVLAGTIRPNTTPRGTTRYEYVYPAGASHPRFFSTVKEAAQEAASFAARVLARSLSRGPQSLANLVVIRAKVAEALDLAQSLGFATVGSGPVRGAYKPISRALIEIDEIGKQVYGQAIYVTAVEASKAQ